MAITKPLNAIIATLCIVVTVQFTETLEVQLAIAKIQTEQKSDAKTTVQVIEMKEVLIRLDENVKFIKENIKELNNAN